MTQLNQRWHWIVIAACVATMIAGPLLVSGFEVVLVWAVASVVLAFTLVLALTSSRALPVSHDKR